MATCHETVTVNGHRCVFTPSGGEDEFERNQSILGIRLIRNESNKSRRQRHDEIAGATNEEL